MNRAPIPSRVWFDPANGSGVSVVRVHAWAAFVQIHGPWNQLRMLR